MSGAALVLVALATGVLAGCAVAEPVAPVAAPEVEPPVIGKEGTLRAGIDVAYPPFAGVDGEQTVGIDVDVASAIAAELGLTLDVVPMERERATEALDAGAVDVVMSVPLEGENVLDMSFAGFYAASGPAIFSAMEETVTPDALGMARIAVQEGSPAFWVLAYDIGEDRLVVSPSLRGAFDALAAGEVDIVAGDAFVGKYIAKDFPGVRFHGQLAPASQLGIAVAPDATRLADVLRGALDALAADGVLDAIRVKWVGDLPELETAYE